MHEVFPSRALLIFFRPVTTNSEYRATALVHRNNIRQFDARGLAVLVHVFKTRDVQINLKLQKENLLRLPCFHHTRLLVYRITDLARIGRTQRVLNVGVQILSGHHALAKLVGVHRNTVRDPRAFAHDA